ncbi:MAG: hypothetical protein IJY43_06895 [Clostridia bacterium]|nr:hypothetical protein [Clostridia bacterium]
MTFSYSKLKKIAFLLLALPTLVFAVGFLRLWVALPVAALLIFAYIWSIRREKEEAEEYQLSLRPWQLLVLLLIISLWCAMSGLGNLYYQSSDWAARNAIFRDLIRFDWPVVYNVSGSALVYYIAFWLPAALFGKLAAFFGADIGHAFAVGNIALLVWSILNMLVIVLLVLLYVRAHSVKRFFITLAIFIGFSGLDIVGALCHRIFGVEIPYHLEWWTSYQYTSMAACLGWVFNQAIPAWLTIICFLHEKKMRNYAFLLVLCAACAPLPCIGLAVYMLVTLIVRAVRACREKRIPELLKEVLTPQNLIATAILLPIWLTYYMTNLAVSADRGLLISEPDRLALGALLALAAIAVGIAVLLYLKKREWIYAAVVGATLLVLALWGNSNLEVNRKYLIAVLLEAVVYLALLAWGYRKTLLYRVAFFSAIFCPLFSIGTAFDFCMRASIPTVFIFMILSIQFLFEHEDVITLRCEVPAQKRVPRVLCFLLITVLLVGSVTAMREFFTGFYAVATEGKLAVVNDHIYTFNRTFEGVRYGAALNFTAAGYPETAFFRFFAK